MKRKTKNKTMAKSNRADYFKGVGQFLKAERERAGVTQQQVADRLKLTSAQYVSNIERGISPPSILFLRTVVEMYGLDSKYLSFTIGKLATDYYLAELAA